MANDEIEVEVIYALPTEQVVVRVKLPAGATVEAAIAASGLMQRYPQIASGPLCAGVFGKIAKPDTPVKAGDRVEIYRALTVEPKEARHRRARIKNSIKSNT